MITKRKSVVCPMDDPTPIAYLNVYEEGDVWAKIKGCEECPAENRAKCCGTCPMFSLQGCYWHLENQARSSKPWNCVVRPSPDVCWSWCSSEFECTQGSRKGQVRKVCEPGNTFR